MSNTFQGQNKVPTPLPKSKAVSVVPQDIKPSDHKTLSGLEPTIEVSNQGHAPYDLNAMLESPTRSGLQPKGKKK